MNALWSRLNIELLVTQFVAWLPSLGASIAIIVAFWILFRATRHTLQRALTTAGLELALATMLVNVYRFALFAFALVMAASQLGIQVGAALAGLGVVGLSIGFAAKDTLSNIMASFLIFWDKPFHVGDWITMGEHYGKVAEITMRTTRVRTRNNTWIVIPNEKIINEVLINHSKNGETRVQVSIGIAYKEDIKKARSVLLEAVASVEGVLANPKPSVIVSELGPSSVDLKILVWVADAEIERPTQFRVLELAKTTLDAAGIQIPFPHVQLFVDSVEDRVWDKAAAIGAGIGNQA